MPSKVRLPDHTITISTYAEVEQYFAAFARGHLNLLIMLGTPGAGKSRAARRALPSPDSLWIEGHATGYGMYCAAYQHLDLPIVVDDVDSLYSDRAAVRLLKALCQTDATKSVGWHSDAKSLDRLGIPKQYETRSRVCVIANEWRTLSVNVAAIEDRGCIVHFAPAPLEVHSEAAGWFWCQEIHDFIGNHMHLLAGRPSFRHYTSAWEFKSAGLDWRGLLLSRWGLSAKEAFVAKLRADAAYKSEEARAQAFIKSAHGCRATYFNLARRLKAKPLAVPRYALTASPPVPPTPAVPAASAPVAAA